MIFNRNFHPIPPTGFKQRSRVLAIVDFTASWSVDAIGIDVLVRDVEVVLSISQQGPMSFRWRSHLSNSSNGRVIVVIGKDVVDPASLIGARNGLLQPGVSVATSCNM